MDELVVFKERIWMFNLKVEAHEQQIEKLKSKFNSLKQKQD